MGAEQKQILHALWSLVVVIIFWCNKFVFLEFFFFTLMWLGAAAFPKTSYECFLS